MQQPPGARVHRRPVIGCQRNVGQRDGGGRNGDAHGRASVTGCGSAASSRPPRANRRRVLAVAAGPGASMKSGARNGRPLARSTRTGSAGRPVLLSTISMVSPSGAKCRLPQASIAISTGREIRAAGGQDVLIPRRPLVVAAAFQQAALDQGGQSPRQHGRRNAEALLEVVEPRDARERVAQDQHAPPLADPLEAARDRAGHLTEALAPHPGTPQSLSS